MVRTGVRMTLPPKVIGLRFLSWVVVGGLLWLLGRSLFLLVVVALVVPAAMVLTGLTQTRRRVGRAVSAGSVLTSAYDDGRPAGDHPRHRRPGARAGNRAGPSNGSGTWRWCAGAPDGDALVTPSALLSDDDVALVTADPPREELPYSVVVTPEVRRDVVRGCSATVCRHPLGIAVLCCWC